MAKRKIAIYTGNRAEYGLQFPIIRAIKNHPDLDYYLLVSGAHLQEDFGFTLGEIQQDGFDVYAEVKIEAGDDTLYGTAQAIGSGILSLSEVLKELKPDILVVYADRFEGFSAVICGSQMNVPIAHIEGGDITEGGALDDSVRHAMSKLAHLHFTTNEEAAERVRKLGEEPWRVFNVGFPAIDLIGDGNYAKPAELAERFNLDLKKPVLVLTQHSVTTEFDRAIDQFAPTVAAMKKLAAEGVQVMVTYPNNDAGGQHIIQSIEALMAENISGIQAHSNLGRYCYHGVLNLVGRDGETTGVCVGNSSSGIKETPAFGCPAVNIGSRQDGRLRASNVIDSSYDCDEIVAACKKAMFDDSFRQHCYTCSNPYGEGNSGPRIAETLATIDISAKLLQKKMTY